ncbi:GbsR/MarR family transcriptional regulator [Nonomuraea sediminis]|uniref:GbsR/MarR family transcriptional regulator n=1 Tax=Nonomuraea sediminis TaxID=2835864 RepID=UPI001BDBFC91|nr:MarR family transcriptional regulator [Nonomuraea sediminis]
MTSWQHSFIEELGALGPEMGIPRAMMRITAWMMVCDPPEQSAQQIQEGLRLSAAAVSTGTRQLITAGMLERVSHPGDRRIYYRLASGSWQGPLEAKLRALGRLRHVADQGIAAAGNQADYRLVEMRDAFAWFEDQLDHLIRNRRRPNP